MELDTGEDVYDPGAGEVRPEWSRITVDRDDRRDGDATAASSSRVSA
jgi:hypothetical protein